MRRTRRRPLVALALLVLLALVAGACGGGDDDDDVTSDSGDTSDTGASDDTRAETSDETKPDDTGPDETQPDDDDADMAIVDEVVDTLGLPLTSAQESCLGEELAAEFDADELETLRDDETLSDDLAERASDVLDLCLPLDDVIYLAGIEQGLAPADADCVAEFIADQFTWADFISGDESIEDSFTAAGEECGTGPGGSTISVPSIPPITTTTRPAATTTTSPAAGGAAPPGTQVSIYDTAPGECWDRAQFEGAGQVYTVLDCAGAHDTETYAVFDLPDGAFPGDDAVQSAANDGCTSSFATYVGIDYAQSQYYLSFFSPTEQTWNDPALRDREVVCILYVPVEPGNDDAGFEQTTGTAAGSGR